MPMRRGGLLWKLECPISGGIEWGQLGPKVRDQLPTKT